ncbi:MAG: hypothetical protein ACXVZ4_10440 [Gaiellaceae bacterium]
MSAESYAVVWGEPDGLASGGLTFVPEGIRLDGKRLLGGSLAGLSIGRDELRSVRIGRARHELIAGRPALIVELADGRTVPISAPGPGILVELADLLSALQSQHAEETGQVVVIAPLREGSLEQARGLIEQGPPFDPESVGLERHLVFATEHEAVFVFDTTDVSLAVSQLADPLLWAAAEAWRSCLGGEPRVAERIYAWPDE